MRWAAQAIGAEEAGALPGLARLSNLIRSVRTPGFEGMVFHEVAARSALNRVPGGSRMPFRWTVNPYRGCTHACAYCFARPTHTYLGLGSGPDFERQLIVKVNVVEVLAAELARPTWGREAVAIGPNADVYQRAEGRYRLMPGIVGALARSGTPLSLLTKGTLLRRDLPLLASASRDVEVGVAMSIAIEDDALQRSLEPGTPSTPARLATLAAARDAGLAPSVFLAPVIPFLTDSEDRLDRLMGRIAEAGAASVGYEILHLRPGVKEWFADWVRRERPELLPRFRALYGRGAYVPDDYRGVVRERVHAAIAAHGLDRMRFSSGDDGEPGGVPREGASVAATLF